MLLVEGHRLGADHLLAGPFIEGSIAGHVSDSVWVAAVARARVYIRVIGILVAASLGISEYIVFEITSLFVQQRDLNHKRPVT